LELGLKSTYHYPIVPCGPERLQITPSPHHSDADIEHPVQALVEIWTGIRLTKAGGVI
jgi:5-aminolevulinate synthase